MHIFAFDLATETGWCVRQADVVLASGTWNLAPKRGDSGGMRFIYLRTRLKELLAAYGKPSHVVYEQAHHRGGAATQVGVGLATHLQGWCAENEIEYTAVPSMTLKKQATGTGKASKDDMMRHASVLVGREITNDNEGDAICLAFYEA